MSKFDNFITLVSAEAIYACLTRPNKSNTRPAAIITVAMQCPSGSLKDSPEELRHQAQELIDWFFGGRDPIWLPESLLYEEIEEEVVEYVPVRVEEEYHYVDPEESYYEQ
jgi:hypothetical protein